MLSKVTACGRSLKGIVALGLLASAVSFSAPASANECPADQVKPGARTSGETMPSGVTDEVRSSIDLSSKGDDWKGNTLRMRKLVIQPGGVVPWHSHAERPATVLIAEGTMTEYRSTCLVPIEHGAGDVTAEFGKDIAHWWKNNGDKPAVLYSADILPPTVDKNAM